MGQLGPPKSPFFSLDKKSILPIMTLNHDSVSTQWLLGLATWQQCKKHDGGGKGRREGKKGRTRLGFSLGLHNK